MAEQTENVQTDMGFLRKIFVKPLTHEQRGLLGPIIFFLIVLLVGWQAINEQHRMEVFTAQYEGRSIERGAVLFQSSCASCHGNDAKGIQGVAPSLNAADLFDGSRLKQAGWTGSLHDYVELTIAAGRPVRSGDWPQAMPTWSQEYGGPLRPDQVADLTNFILNYSKFYESGYEAPTGVVTEEPGEPFFAIGLDLDTELPEGDAARGEALLNNGQGAPDGSGNLGCVGCHPAGGGVGPDLATIGERVPDGYDSVEAYIRESIVNPNAVLADGYAADIMPKNFGDRLDAQALADLIAHIAGLGQ